MRDLLTNIASLRTQRYLSATTSSLGKVYERLSSGLRISRASDDAAGLLVSSQLNTNSRIYSQGIRNVNDAISIFNIAESAISELSNTLVRITELAEQSANGVLSTPQRSALDDEAQALRLEFNRIIDTTSFNGLALLDGSLAELSLQTGGERLDVGIANLGTSVFGDGTFQIGEVIDANDDTKVVATTDINNDGISDLVYVVGNWSHISLGRGDGTFSFVRSYFAGAGASDLLLTDVNGDGVVDLIVGTHDDNKVNVRIGLGDGTFKTNQTFVAGDFYFGTGSITAADFDGDGIIDLAAATGSSSNINILIGNGDGTYKARVSYVNGGTPWDIVTADLNGDGVADLITASATHNRFDVYLGNGDGSFNARLANAVGDTPRTVNVYDLNGDGILDVVTASVEDDRISVSFGNGDGTFKARTFYNTGDYPHDFSAGDLNGDGFLDIVTASGSDGKINVLFGNGDGSFQANVSYFGGAAVRSVAIADFNNDGVLDLVSASYTSRQVNILLGNTIISSSLSPFSLRTQNEALISLDRLEDSRRNLSRAAGNIGSSTSRLNVAASVLLQNREGTEAAASQIMNADIADESAKLMRLNILQEAATAILAQANGIPALVLELLRE